MYVLEEYYYVCKVYGLMLLLFLGKNVPWFLNPLVSLGNMNLQIKKL